MKPLLSNPMATTARRSDRPLLNLASATALLFTLCSVLFVWRCAEYFGLTFRSIHSPLKTLKSNKSGFTYDFAKHAKHNALSADQCEAAFPRLFDVLDATAARRKVTKISYDEIRIEPDKCLVRVLIFDAELFIVQGTQNKGCWMSRWHERTSGLLHSIHTAISGVDPATIPNIEFVLDLDDDPQRPISSIHGKADSTASTVWGLTRRPTQHHIWLMPDYSFWAWPSALAPSHNHARRQAAETNAQYPWAAKLPQVVWRGTTHLNPTIRDPLVAATRHKPWADVAVCDVADPATAARCIPQHAHCKYRFPVHTEGYTYSGRLKFLQLCASAPVIHPLLWAEHHTHLLVADGPAQNYIPVRADWADLEGRVSWYAAHDGAARRVAENSHGAFAQRYLTPAATACYWRAMVRRWADVQGFVPALYDAEGGALRGVPFEAWAVNASAAVGDV